MTLPFKQSEKGNCIKVMLIGCGLMVVLIGMVMVGTYYYLKNHGAEFFSDLMTGFIDTALYESGLPEEDQEKIKEQVARVTDKLKAGEITEEHLTRFSDVFGDGDLFYLFLFEAVEHKSIPESTLSQEEKEDAVRVIHRTKRGLIEGSFTPDQLIYIQKAIPMETDNYGNEQPVENPTDEQLSDLVGDLQIVNDQAEIPEGDYKIDYVNYVRDLVDEILGEESATIVIPDASGEIKSATGVVSPASPTLN